MRTFSIGGIHPSENKLSAKQAITIAGIPGQAVISLSQHIGAQADAIVMRGDKVKVGSLIAKASGRISANVHSSVSGTVNKIGVVSDSSGIYWPAVYIDVEGDEWEEVIDRSETPVKECTLSSKEIIDKIADAGIVGLGGATFPTHIKLTPPAGYKVEVLIINAVECEPYLTSDHALMLEKGTQILIGAKILMKALQINRVMIAIENNKPDAIAHLTKLAAAYTGIDVIPLKVKYPQGSEKHLIDAMLNRQVKSGSLPVSVGAIVQNVATVYAVYEAVQKNKPLIERVVTITGNAIAKPSNLLVRIGTPVHELIREVGGLPENTGKVIKGGPMMGKALINTDIPVTKKCSCFLIMPKNDTVRKPARNCIRCAKCLNVCPMGLNPSLLMSVTEFNRWDLAEKNNISDCIECGCCSYSCPAHKPLLDYIRLGKAKFAGIMGAREI